MKIRWTLSPSEIDPDDVHKAAKKILKQHPGARWVGLQHEEDGPGPDDSWEPDWAWGTYVLLLRDEDNAPCRAILQFHDVAEDASERRATLTVDSAREGSRRCWPALISVAGELAERFGVEHRLELPDERDDEDPSQLA